MMSQRTLSWDLSSIQKQRVENTEVTKNGDDTIQGNKKIFFKKKKPHENDWIGKEVTDEIHIR